MTKFRNRPKQRFIAIIVKPESDFRPTTWQDVPRNYRVIEFVGEKQFRGRADAWRFMENKESIDSVESNQPVGRWAIVID